MAEEFVDFLKGLNNKSIEDQLEELKKVVNKMIDLFVNFLDNCTFEFNVINKKITSLETKLINKGQEKIIEPPLNSSRNIGNENTRIALMGELNNLFNKKNNLGKRR